MGVGTWGKRLVRVAEAAFDISELPGPHPTTRTAGFDLRCPARITGIADIAPDHGPDQPTQQMALVGLEVHRPEGVVRTCVRQDIPPEIQARVVPGLPVQVSAHPADASRAYVMWGTAPGGGTLVISSIIAWPEPEHWPRDHAIEFFPKARRTDELTRLRASRQAWAGALADLRPTMRRTGGRPVMVLAVDLPTPGGRQRREVTSAVPDLALARLRPGAPIVVLISPDGAHADPDWEATVARPENWTVA